MLGSFLTRGLVMVLGYAYPAFECYKTVEKNRPQIEELRFWCQYWILVALLTVTERIGDVFISWLPMYSEAKLAFYIYLWYPKTRGTSYVYDSFFKPYMEKHETEIDRSLFELKTMAGDIAHIYWQKSASYVQTRIVDILHFVAAQSTLRSRTAQTEQVTAKVHRTTSGISRLTGNARPEVDESQSPTSITSSSQKSVEEGVVLAPAPKKAPAASKTAISAPTAPNSPKPKPTLKPKSLVTVSPPLDVAETSMKAAVSASDDMVTDITIVAAPEVSDPPPKDTVMEDTLRVTRAKLRKNRSTAGTEA